MFARDPDSRGLLATPEPASDLVEPDRPVKRAGRDVLLAEQVVQVPTQPPLLVGAIGDQVVAVVEQQADLECPLVEVRRRQPLDALPERGPSDRERVNQVGLPARPRAATRARHQLRRDAHHPLATSDKEPLEPARHVTTLLDSPNPLAAKRTPPRQRPLKPAGRRLHGLAATQLARSGVHRPKSEARLVWVRTDHDH